MEWLFRNHYKKTYAFMVFIAVSPSFIVMAQDGAHPMNLTVISLWMMVLLNESLKKDDIINRALSGLENAFSVIEMWGKMVTKIKEEDPKLYQKLMEFADRAKK